MLNKIFLVVPKLIEQSTWGGEYILQFKNWQNKKEFQNLKIGQSYELFSESKLRTDINSSQDPSFTGEMGFSMEPDKIHYQGDESKLISLKGLIRKDPEAVLGKKVLGLDGEQPVILIKFTQAKGNSFQLHVRKKDESEKWKTKPESWYYFEPGLITLGVKPQINWPAWENACLALEKETINLGQQVQAKKTSLAQALEKATQSIKKYNPWQYVNLVKVKKGELVDLSECGLHHSWEEDDKNYPLGNIVYELCKDVMDPISTVRAFDRGKIKADGSVRKLNIKEYFQYIDRCEKTNNPQNHIFQGKVILNQPEIKITNLLRSKHYTLDKIMLQKAYAGPQSQTEQSYHHLFVQKGSVLVKAKTNQIQLGQGHACFIPSCLGQYELIPNPETELLKTFIT